MKKDDILAAIADQIPLWYQYTKYGTPTEVIPVGQTTMCGQSQWLVKVVSTGKIITTTSVSLRGTWEDALTKKAEIDRQTAAEESRRRLRIAELTQVKNDIIAALPHLRGRVTIKEYDPPRIIISAQVKEQDETKQ